MLGGVERDELDLGVRGQQVDRGGAVPVPSRVVGDEPDPAAAHQRERVAQEDLDAGADGGRGCHLRVRGAFGGRDGCTSRIVPGRTRGGEERDEQGCADVLPGAGAGAARLPPTRRRIGA